MTVLVFSSCNSQALKNEEERVIVDSMTQSINVEVITIGASKNIRITNHSIDTLWYYIGVQLWDNERWNEVVDDINPKAPDRTAYPKQILPGKHITRICNLSTIIPDRIKNDTAKYNFKINYGKTVDSLSNYIETTEFKLNKQ